MPTKYCTECDWGDPEECANGCGDDRCAVICRVCGALDYACED
jgi:hypothetical protein